jgi:glycine/D-amino acid oxidase-like deaminating enzyme
VRRGGGYTGLSAALHLAEGGTSVCLLEAADIGFGGAGRNVGLVNAGLWVMPDVVIETLGEVYGNRLLDLLGNGPHDVFALVAKHQIACEATPKGTLHCAVGHEGVNELKAREKQWQARKAPVRLLSRSETAARIGSVAYEGALLDERAGTIQPLAYVRGLAEAAIRAGAKLFTHSPVIARKDLSDGMVVSTLQGSVRAGKVIVATDAYSTGPFSALRREQVHLPYFNFATTPLSAAQLAEILPQKEGAWDTKEVLSSFRLDQQGRLVFGSVGALKGVGRDIHHGWARRAMHHIFPQLKGIEFTHEWYGQIGMTDDNLPRFHKMGPHMVAISGYNGRGISPGTVMGRILAHYIMGQLGDEDLPLPITETKDAAWRHPKELMYEWGANGVHLVENRLN